MSASTAPRINRRGIVWFVVISFGLAWLFDLPMALTGGFNSPWSLLITLQNFTPALATLLVARWISPLPNMRRATGLRWGAKGSRWGWYWLFGLAGMTLFNVAAPFVGALLGVFPLDLAHLSGLREALLHNGGAPLVHQVPLATIALVILVTLPLQALVISPINFGEEWGWRGYLLPQLIRAGWPFPLVFSGLVWGIWHFPLFFLTGYAHGAVSVSLVMFTLLTVLFGVFIGWLRLVSGSVFVAAMAHASFNGFVQIFFGVSFVGKGAWFWVGDYGALTLLSYAFLVAWLYQSRRVHAVLTATIIL